MINSNSKKCPECGTAFRGRTDKKFCSDQCRSAHNNRINSDCSDYIRRINYILKRNRRILSELFQEGRDKVVAEKLKIRGFDFNYFTSMHISRDGSQYYYCYDVGYLPVDDDVYQLVSKSDPF